MEGAIGGTFSPLQIGKKYVCGLAPRLRTRPQGRPPGLFYLDWVPGHQSGLKCCPCMRWHAPCRIAGHAG